MRKLAVEIVSSFDREKLVAEIWESDQIIAEINQDGGVLKVEFYFTKRKMFDLDELMKTLELAKSRLITESGS